MRPREAEGEAKKCSQKEIRVRAACICRIVLACVQRVYIVYIYMQGLPFCFSRVIASFFFVFDDRDAFYIEPRLRSYFRDFQAARYIVGVFLCHILDTHYPY